ncbi:unnamed protein product [Hymenolepis diminuta]|uniref:Uncharacterized protein n=1 Tax=Hymenolepis diminuta TaxID=6216 RepID=A0A564XZU5_HYMDI|nr:unnamed protein product [Hymenolepis diminuta]
MRVLTRSVGYKQPSMRHTDTPGNPSSPGASLVVQSSISLFFLETVLSLVQCNLVNAILGVLFLSFTLGAIT